MVIRPLARPQVATARPSMRAKGLNRPLVVTMPVWPARISELDDHPCRRGSNGPASLGGGKTAEGSRPVRSKRSSLILDTWSPAAARPRRASSNPIPAHLARSALPAGP